MKRIKFVYIYFLFLFYLIGGYFINVPFINRGIYEKIYKYLGIMLIPTLLFFILYGFVFLIKDKKLRFFWELRLYYTFIFFIIAVYLYILFSSGVYFINVRNFEVNGEFLRNLINKSLFEYNIGYLPTYILYELINISLKFNQYPFYYFYYFLIGFEAFLIILMIFSPMRRSIIKSNIKRKKERQRAKIEAELMEQIKIKEDLERKEALKIQKHKKMEEDAIKKKADNFEKMNTSNIEEKSDKKIITERILDIAEKKLEQIAKNNKNKFILAADTVVELNGKIFGKPKNREEAFSFLKTLSGQIHRVITAYVFKNISKNILIKEIVVSEVKFFDLDDETINWYLDTGEPFDKAGAYGIQGYGRILVEKINGDFYSIMGFPISNFLENLRKIGYKISQIDKI